MRLDFLQIKGTTQVRIAAVTVEGGQLVVSGRLPETIERELADLHERHPKQFFERAQREYTGAYLRAKIVETES